MGRLYLDRSLPTRRLKEGKILRLRGCCAAKLAEKQHRLDKEVNNRASDAATESSYTSFESKPELESLEIKPLVPRKANSKRYNEPNKNGPTPRESRFLH